jgi:hypothetical protein
MLESIYEKLEVFQSDVSDAIDCIYEELERIQIKNQYAETVDKLLDDAFNTRKRMVENFLNILENRIGAGIRGNYQTSEWLNEFATLAISLGRQTGSTYFAARFGDICPNSTIAYVAPTLRMGYTFASRLCDVTSDIKYIFTPDTIQSSKENYKIDYLIVDNADLCTDFHLDCIYDFAERQNVKAIIKLF